MPQSRNFTIKDVRIHFRADAPADEAFAELAEKLKTLGAYLTGPGEILEGNYTHTDCKTCNHACALKDVSGECKSYRKKGNQQT